MNPLNICMHLNIYMSVSLSFVSSTNMQILMNENTTCKKKGKGKEKIPLAPSPSIRFVKSQLTLS